MTAKELIKILEKLPHGTHVFTRGYEGGLNDAVPGELTRVRLNHPSNTAWYYGPHEEVEDDYKGKTVKGVIL